MHKRVLTLGAGTLSIETGRLARQANGSAVVTFGDTVVLVTACYAPSERVGIDFLPLTVDRELHTHQGASPGFSSGRARRPKGSLTSRCIDRPIRPFPDTWHHRRGHRARALGRQQSDGCRRHHRRVGGAGLLGIRSGRRWLRCASGVDDAFVINQPTPSATVALDIIVAAARTAW